MLTIAETLLMLGKMAALWAVDTAGTALARRFGTL
jgi:hypothetical protein